MKSANCITRKMHCNICDTTCHHNSACKTYSTAESHLARCRELRLCFYCASNGHMGNMYSLKIACIVKRTGIYLSCVIRNQWIIYSMLSKPLLSINVRMTFSLGNWNIAANSLLDTGIQRTLVSQDVLESLNCKKKILITIMNYLYKHS